MRVIDHLKKVLELLLFALLMFMVIAVFGNVVLRYLFHSGISAVEELSRFAFVWITFIGGVILLREKGHLGFDSLMRKLPSIGQEFCRVLSNLLIIFIAGLLVVGGWNQVLSSIGAYSQSAAFPMAVFFGIGPLAGVLMVIIALEDLYFSLRKHRDAFVRTVAIQKR